MAADASYGSISVSTSLLLIFFILVSSRPVCSTLNSASKSVKAFNVTAVCPRILNATTLKPLKPINSSGGGGRRPRPLRVLVPWKVGFEQLVSFTPDSCRLDGFSVQVFKQALEFYWPNLDAVPSCQFVLYGDGHKTPEYEGMVEFLVNKTVDVVVADLTITKDRMEKVAFTVPYLAPSTLVMVTTYRYGSKNTKLDIFKPFPWQIWVALLGCFVATGIALCILEYQNAEFATTTVKKRDGDSPGGSFVQSRPIASTSDSMPVVAANMNFPSPPPTSESDPPPNPPSSTLITEHATPPLNISNSLTNDNNTTLQHPNLPDTGPRYQRLLNAFWFTALGIFTAQRESVHTHSGRFVTITWLSVMLIFNSSYTASLTSLLSAQKKNPTVKSFEDLKRNSSISVGYQEGSFTEKYMTKLGMDRHENKTFTSEIDFVQALKKGNSDPNGVGVVVDELPYMQILLQSECELTISSTDADHLPSFNGFGFAFQKDDPLVSTMSEAILAMGEDEALQKLQSLWRIGDDSGGTCDSNDDPSHMRLRSFVWLFYIAGAVYLICVVWRYGWKAIKSLRARIRINPERTKQEPTKQEVLRLPSFNQNNQHLRKRTLSSTSIGLPAESDGAVPPQS